MRAHNTKEGFLLCYYECNDDVGCTSTDFVVAWCCNSAGYGHDWYWCNESGWYCWATSVAGSVLRWRRVMLQSADGTHDLVYGCTRSCISLEYQLEVSLCSKVSRCLERPQSSETHWKSILSLYLVSRSYFTRSFIACLPSRSVVFRMFSLLGVNFTLNGSGRQFDPLLSPVSAAAATPSLG